MQEIERGDSGVRSTLRFNRLSYVSMRTTTQAAIHQNQPEFMGCWFRTNGSDPEDGLPALKIGDYLLLNEQNGISKCSLQISRRLGKKMKKEEFTDLYEVFYYNYNK
jgi:hypothetical protein